MTYRSGEEPKLDDLVFVPRFDVGFRVRSISETTVVADSAFEWSSGICRSEFSISQCRLLERA